MQRPRSAPIVLLAVIGTLACAGSILYLNLTVDHSVVALITPGRQFVAYPLIHHDFPHYTVQDGLGHDGQSFYAIAREPMHLKDASQWLDRPRYRLQRILLPMLAWAVHPQGGGDGLVLALWFWAVVGVFLTGFGSALLAGALGANERAVHRIALFTPLLPAALATLDLTVADELALGLAVMALALDCLERRRSAVALAVLAVLAKEVMLLVFLGWALYRGRACLLRLVVLPGAVALTWWVVLRVWFASSHEHIGEFSFVSGVVESLKIWIRGDNRIAGATVAAGVVLGIVVLVRKGWHSPLGPAVALQLALIPFLHQTVLAGDWNGTRATAPLLLLSIVALCIPKAPETPDAPAISQPHAARA
jgi:hypothetical protein